MSEVFSFTSANRAALIEELASRDMPLRLRVVPHGPARHLSREVVLRVCSGRLVAIAAPDLPASRALLRVALADSGRIEVSTDEPPPAPLGSFPAIRRLYADAETAARALASVLQPFGGLGSIVTAKSDGVMRAASHLSRPALELGRMLIDVPRRVADVLSSLAQDDLQTARLLDQLRDAGALDVTAPSSGESGVRARPTERAAPSSARPRGTRRSLPPAMRPSRRASGSLRPSSPPQQKLEVPELAEDEAPRDALSAEAWAQVGKPPAPEIERVSAVDDQIRSPSRGRFAPSPQRSDFGPRNDPGPARGDAGAIPPREERREASRGPRRDVVEEELAAMRAAGVGDSNRTVWTIAAAIAIVALAIGLYLGRRQPEPQKLPPIEVPIVEVPVKTTTTTTIAKPIAPPKEEYSLSRPPPIAGPDADRRLREAEAMINAGDYEGAEEILSEMRKTNPDDATVWLLSCHLETERGNFSKALEYIDRALQIAPRNYRAHVLKGSVFQFQGRIENAIASYKRALSIDPKHVMSSELKEVAERLERDRG